MTLSDFASIATVISGVAVLGSLIYLSLQTRQNTKHIQALLWQGAADRGVNMNLTMADEDLTAAFISGNGATPTPDAIAKRQFQLQCTALYAQIDDLFTQWDDGLIGDDRFLRFRSTVVGMLAANCGVREFFAARVAAMPDTSYHAFLAAVLAQTQAH
ncbi:MAG TPA: hypothetical protein VGM17_16995 [Rhizomicrobium sp.]|jgi:hypothetical protein